MRKTVFILKTGNVFLGKFSDFISQKRSTIFFLIGSNYDVNTIKNYIIKNMRGKVIKNLNIKKYFLIICVNLA
jgi:hypothetical protein